MAVAQVAVLLWLYLAAASPSAAAAASDTHLQRVNVQGALCLDGSSAPLFYRESPYNSSTLVIFLDGGASCTRFEDCSDWGTQGTDEMGKASTSRQLSRPILDRDCSLNPDFCTASMALVPSCTGDLHSGTRSPFSGHTNLARFVDILVDAVPATTHVLLTGVGAGVYINADYVAQRFSNATVKASPVAAYSPGALPAEDSPCPDVFSDYSYQSSGTPGSSACTNGREAPDLWGAHNVSEVCIDELGDEWWKCHFPHTAAGYIETPLYWAQNEFDIDRIFVPEGPVNDGSDATKAFMSYFGAATAASMSTQLPAKDGAFVPSCAAHTSMDADIDGVEYLPSLGEWFWERSDPVILFDVCVSTESLPCNPACTAAGGSLRGGAYREPDRVRF